MKSLHILCGFIVLATAFPRVSSANLQSTKSASDHSVTRSTLKPGTDVVFTSKLQADTTGFITDLHNWIERLVGTVDNAELLTSSEFEVKISDSVDTQHLCGNLVSGDTFNQVKKFLDTPKTATLTESDAETFIWRPSSDCLSKQNSYFVNGTTHATFVATCGDETLLTVSTVSGGVTKQFLGKQVESTGAMIAANFDDNTVNAVGATGTQTSALELRVMPNNVNNVMKMWKKTIRQCASHNSLSFKGVVGGGWIQKFSHFPELGSSTTTSAVQYANTFEISYHGKPSVPTQAPSTAMSSTGSSDAGDFHWAPGSSKTGSGSVGGFNAGSGSFAAPNAGSGSTQTSDSNASAGMDHDAPSTTLPVTYSPIHIPPTDVGATDTEVSSFSSASASMATGSSSQDDAGSSDEAFIGEGSTDPAASISHTTEIIPFIPTPSSDPMSQSFVASQGEHTVKTATAHETTTSSPSGFFFAGMGVALVAAAVAFTVYRTRIRRSNYDSLPTRATF